MIADLNSMPRIYWYCRKKFFNNELPDPNFDIIHSFKVMARFNYRKTKKKDKKKGRKWKTLEYKCISFSDYFDFDEETFINIMAHEMIHYYIAEHQIKDNKAHGREFMRIAQELNEKYGLHITKTVDGYFFGVVIAYDKAHFLRFVVRAGREGYCCDGHSHQIENLFHNLFCFKFVIE